MFTTRTLRSLKEFLPKIHQPLPLTQREAQKLLKTLTTSFRKNLDKEHGWNHDNTIVSSGPAGPSSPPCDALLHDDSERRLTDYHVRGILSNPLFSYDLVTRSRTLAAGQRDPMDVFDEAVAKGLMTFQRAAGVLKAKRNAILHSPNPISAKNNPGKSCTAIRVLRWLRSSGHERSLSFVSSTPLVLHLTQSLVEEGLDEIAWLWLERLMRGEGPALIDRNSPSPVAHILYSLVRTKALYGRDLDGGYSSLVRARQLFHTVPSFETDAISAWRALAWWSTVSAPERLQPSEASYNAFAAMGLQLQKLKPNLRLDRAHLELHHPVYPDATPAIAYLKSASLKKLLDQERQERDEVFHTFSLSSKYNALITRIGLMSMDTVRHLARIGQEEEAGRVRDTFLHKFGRSLVTAFRGGPEAAGLDTNHHEFQLAKLTG